MQPDLISVFQATNAENSKQYTTQGGKHMIKLKDLLSIIPADIETGVILGRTKETNKTFHDISELTAQFTMDYVETFDIRTDREGNRRLVVKLAHWGN